MRTTIGGKLLMLEKLLIALPGVFPLFCPHEITKSDTIGCTINTTSPKQIRCLTFVEQVTLQEDTLTKENMISKMAHVCNILFKNGDVASYEQMRMYYECNERNEVANNVTGLLPEGFANVELNGSDPLCFSFNRFSGVKLGEKRTACFQQNKTLNVSDEVLQDENGQLYDLVEARQSPLCRLFNFQTCGNLTLNEFVACGESFDKWAYFPCVSDPMDSDDKSLCVFDDEKGVCFQQSVESTKDNENSSITECSCPCTISQWGNWIEWELSLDKRIQIRYRAPDYAFRKKCNENVRNCCSETRTITAPKITDCPSGTIKQNSNGEWQCVCSFGYYGKKCEHELPGDQAYKGDDSLVDENRNKYSLMTGILVAVIINSVAILLHAVISNRKVATSQESISQKSKTVDSSELDSSRRERTIEAFVDNVESSYFIAKKAQPPSKRT